MAMRAPSCASRKASPRPIPLLPPVTSATRLRSDILLPGEISSEDFQSSPGAAEVLPKPRDNEGREAVVARVADEMLIQTGHQFRSAQAVAALRKQLAAQRRLKTGHQKGSGNSLPRNIGDGQGNMSRAKLNKVIIVTTD